MFGKVATQTTQTTHGRHDGSISKIVRKLCYSALLKLRCALYVRAKINSKNKSEFL